MRVDHYPGLSGKGLCARALYDYQAGTVPTHPRPQAPQGGTPRGVRRQEGERGAGLSVGPRQLFIHSVTPLCPPCHRA